VLAPAIVVTGATFPFAPAAYSVMLLPLPFAT
jgi:hypothetical protein